MPNQLRVLAQRRKLLGTIERLAESPSLERSRKPTAPVDRGCHCQGDGPKHGPHLNVSLPRREGQDPGYYVPRERRRLREKGWPLGNKCKQCLRELAELNKDRNLQRAREANSQ